MKLIDRIKKNKGITLNVHTNRTKKTGFAVSLTGFETKAHTLNERVLNTYLETNKVILSKQNHFFGAWIENDLTYFDVSIIVRSKKQAISLGRQNKQLAIFDLKKLQTIYI